MKQNELYQNGSELIRILRLKENEVLYIDCNKRTMPVWGSNESSYPFKFVTEDVLEITIENESDIEPDRRRIMYQRYNRQLIR